jgi:hypothetical protein
LKLEDGVRLSEQEINSDLIRLFENLSISSKKKIKKVKTDTIDEKNETSIILQLIKMNGNNRSQIFTSSADWVNPKNIELLLEKRFIQSIPSENGEKYALSLAGIAECIRIKSQISLEDQYITFLHNADKEFNKIEDPHLEWKEKLATLSLTLLGSTSQLSAITLDNNQNQAVLAEVFQEVLSCLKRYGLVEQKEELKPSSRGENPIAGVFARLDTLPRKTNHYYYGKDYVYYISVETKQEIDFDKLTFIFKKIFDGYEGSYNYADMYQELSRISQKYSPRFLGRSINPSILLVMLGQLKEFLDTDIYHLMPKKNTI